MRSTMRGTSIIVTGTARMGIAMRMPFRAVLVGETAVQESRGQT
ncbi:hypothetical protein BIFGAL_04465, partial [Bifidobacterium gallicum DSM 20093 = LMG 11596]